MKTISFGNYWQSNNTDKEPIEWIVLKEEEDKMYVLSKYCLDCVPYSNGNKTIWEDSFARKWLNTKFINNAFSVEEQDKILLSDIKTDKWWGTRLDKGTPVKDKIFLPSISEAILYLIVLSGTILWQSKKELQDQRIMLMNEDVGHIHLNTEKLKIFLNSEVVCKKILTKTTLTGIMKTA